MHRPLRRQAVPRACIHILYIYIYICVCVYVCEDCARTRYITFIVCMSPFDRWKKSCTAQDPHAAVIPREITGTIGGERFPVLSVIPRSRTPQSKILESKPQSINPYLPRSPHHQSEAQTSKCTTYTLNPHHLFHSAALNPKPYLCVQSPSFHFLVLRSHNSCPKAKNNLVQTCKPERVFL